MKIKLTGKDIYESHKKLDKFLSEHKDCIIEDVNFKRGKKTYSIFVKYRKVLNLKEVK